MAPLPMPAYALVLGGCLLLGNNSYSPHNHVCIPSKRVDIFTYPLSLTLKKFRRLRIILAMTTMYKMFMVRNISEKAKL